MKAKAFRNISLLAMVFASLASPALNAQDACNNRSSSSSAEDVLTVNVDPVYLSRAYWNQQARYLHDAAVAYGDATNGLTAGAITGQITALNTANSSTSLNLGNLYTSGSKHNHSAVTAAQITSLLNQFFVAGVVTFTTYQDGNSAGGLASYNNWLAIGNQLAVTLGTLSSKIDVATLQSKLTLYVQLQDQQFFNYSTGHTTGAGNGTYLQGVVLNDQAVAVADAIGVYLAQRISGLNGTVDFSFNPFLNIADHDVNYVPQFAVR
jgi:hypothetical protein